MPPKKSASTKAKPRHRSPDVDSSEDELDQSPPRSTKGGKNKRQESETDHVEHKKPKNGKTTHNGDKKRPTKWTEDDKARLAELGSDVDDATLEDEFPDHTLRSVKVMKTKMAPESTKKEKKEDKAKSKVEKEKKEKKPKKTEKAEKSEKSAKKIATTSKKKESPEVVIDKRTTAPKNKAKKKNKEPADLSSLSSDDHEEDEKASLDDGMSDVASHAETNQNVYEYVDPDPISATEFNRAFACYVQSPVRSQMWDLFRDLIIRSEGDELKKYTREEWEWAFSNHFTEYVRSMEDHVEETVYTRVEVESICHDQHDLEHDDDKGTNATQEVEMTH